MTRFYIPLTNEEFVTLAKSAQRECRNPRDQARYILRIALLNEQVVESSKPTIAESLATRSNSGLVNANP